MQIVIYKIIFILPNNKDSYAKARMTHCPKIRKSPSDIMIMNIILYTFTCVFSFSIFLSSDVVSISVLHHGYCEELKNNFIHFFYVNDEI